MSDKRPPRWKMPTRERDAAPVRRPTTSSGIDDLSQITPPPHDVTAIQAYAHADRIAQRTADGILAIAESSGAGMDVVARVDRVEKKLKWWQALAIAALTGAGTAIYSTAKGLYARGEKEGVNEMRLQSCEQRAIRVEVGLDRIRDEMVMYRFTRRNEPSPATVNSPRKEP